MIKRILALLLALALLAMVIITFIFGITGSEYFMGMLFLCFVVPVLCYAIALVDRLLKRKSKDLEAEVMKSVKSDETSDSNQE